MDKPSLSQGNWWCLASKNRQTPADLNSLTGYLRDKTEAVNKALKQLFRKSNKAF